MRNRPGILVRCSRSRDRHPRLLGRRRDQDSARVEGRESRGGNPGSAGEQGLARDRAGRAATGDPRKRDHGRGGSEESERGDRMRRGQLELYAVGAVTAAALISSVLLLWRPGTALGTIALAAIAPSLLLGFIGLASRYLCRALPLRSTSPTTLLTTHGGSAAAA